MTKRRVVITGMGAVTPCGIGVKNFWNTMLEGKSGVSLIESIDGQVMDAFKIESWVRKLPMADTNTILKHAEILNKSFGLDTVVKVECKECGVDYDTPFRITPEFFGPSIDI